jgi:hypothetical protein
MVINNRSFDSNGWVLMFLDAFVSGASQPLFKWLCSMGGDRLNYAKNGFGVRHF